MKKKKAFALFCVGILAVSLAGCGLFSGRDSSATRENRKEKESPIVEESEEEESNEKATSTVEEEEAASVFSPEAMAIKKSYFQTAEDGTVLLEGSSAAPVLTESGEEFFPELGKALRQEAEKHLQEREKEIQEEIQDAKEQYSYPDGFFGQYEDEEGVSIMRMDEKVASFFFPRQAYLGGAHGSNWYDCATYDSRTGKRLVLADVLADEASLTGIIREELLAAYPEPDFLWEMEDSLPHYDPSLLEYEETEDWENYKVPYIWALTPAGLLLYFDAYALNSYAEGSQEVILSYEKYPELFAPAYVPEAQEAFFFHLEYSSRLFDGDGDGEIDEITVSPEYSYDEEEVTIKKFSLSFNESTAEVGELYLSGARDYSAYFVRTGNGKNYLYLLCNEMDNALRLSVFDFAGGKISLAGEKWYQRPIVSYDDTNGYTERLLSDPDHFWLDSRFDILASFLAGKYYHVGPDGMPESEEEVYQVSSWGSYGELVSKADIDCQIVDEEGNVLSEETLPIGESFQGLRTDGKTYIDCRISDGRIVRLKITSTEFPCEINGISAEELFEELYYAS